MRGRISGLGIPQLIVDLPGGKGKIPLLPNYIEDVNDGSITFKNYRGEVVVYPDKKC